MAEDDSLFGAEDDDFVNQEKFDDGLPKKRKRGPGRPKLPKVKKNVKHALKPERMFFKDDERKMYAEYFNRFKHDVEERYNTFTTSQEIMVDMLCYAIIRLERKSRLESWFGRFFDRVAPHDPLGQINQTIKSLGLLPEKKEKEMSGGAAEIKKILSQESLEGEHIGPGKESYEDWLAMRENAPATESFQIRTPDILPNYSDDDANIFGEDEDSEEKV